MTVNKTKQEENVPKLRFSEFEGKWKEKRLGDVGEIKTGTTPPTSQSEYYDGMYPWVTPTDIGKNKNIHESERQLTEEGMRMARLLPKDTLMVTCIASIGKNSILKKEGSCNQQINTITPNEDNNVDFLYYLIEQNTNTLLRHASSGGMKILNKTDFSKIKFAFPSQEEQHKIASFLSAVDEWVENLKGQKREWEMYKKGLMQKMFSSEDGQAPEIRFKDEGGKEFPEWEEKRFSAIYSFHKTNSLSRANLTDEKKQVMNIHYGDIHKKDLTHFDFDKVQLSYLINSDFNSELCFDGDLIIADASEDRNDVGKSAELINIRKKNITSGLHTFLARPKGMALGFSGYLMKTEYIRKQLWKIATGASVLGISKTELGKLKIYLPKKEEQQKIASFLNAVDEVIDSYQQKITRVEEWKKGLMQKMFI